MSAQRMRRTAMAWAIVATRMPTDSPRHPRADAALNEETAP